MHAESSEHQLISPEDTEVSNGTILKYTGTASNIIIPGYISSVQDPRGTGLFHDCNPISAFHVNIGERAFQRCTGLTSVTIPEGVMSIGVEEF